MIRVAALYTNTPGTRFDMDYYVNKHVPFAKAELAVAGLVSLEVDKGICGMGAGTPPPFHAIGYMTFPSLANFEKAMAEVAPKLLADVPNYTDCQLQLQVSEVA